MTTPFLKDCRSSVPEGDSSSSEVDSLPSDLSSGYPSASKISGLSDFFFSE